MRVAINTLSHVTGGGITYFENVLGHLADDGNEYVILVPAGRGKITRPAADNLRFVTAGIDTRSLPARLFYEQAILPVRLWQWDVDVIFSPADLTPLLAPCPAVLAVRNPNPYFDSPELQRTTYRRIKFRLQRYLTWLSARKADAVFFVSEFSKRVTNRYLGLPERKTSVIHHGIDPTLFEDPVQPEDENLVEILKSEPYILCVSTINEHKNYETLLRGYAKLPEQIRAEFRLVIAGRNSAPSYFETLQRILDEEGIENQVEFLGEVPYRSVPYLYEHATAYVLPSKLETFGHTLVEATVSGTPVVAADATCIPEITDGAASLFDPDEPAELAESLEEVLTDETVHDKLVDAGRNRAAAFSWDKTVERTRELLKAVVEGKLS
jgi:glycosyltransferase involved in cell wall biosynthesis